jgi:hypothetical protein
MTRRRLAAVAALVLAASPAWADFKDTYRKGLEAVDRKRWAEVESLMRESIAQNPKEGASIKTYGVRFETYLPYFHLGIALSQTGQCAEALKAFESSETQGAVRDSPYYGQLVSARTQCQKLAAVVPPPTERPAPPTVATTQPAAVTTTLPPTTQTTLRPVPSATPRPTPTPAATPTPAPARTPAPAGPGAPPQELVRAADAYFGGRYAEALSLLDALPGQSGRLAAQADLFRAAALFALYRMGGETDAGLRTRAIQHVAACRLADAGLMPDADAFPPSFAELFRAGR